MKTNVIMDVSYLFRMTFHAHSKEQDDILLAMANKSFMDIINKYYRESKCDEVVLAFDGPKNWRKSYTRNAPDPTNENCITFKKYKGQRKDKLTEAELEKLKRFDEHVVEFREMLREYTGLLVLYHERLEADDLIGGFIKSRPDEKHLIVSSDRDYLQLQRFPGVAQLDPKTGKKLNLIDYDHDAEYFMFQKCIRGDNGDNVMSAYPRVRETKIKAAYESDYERNNLMQNVFEVAYIHPKTGDAIKRKFVTGDVFEENEMLMDLTKQPDVIQDMITDAIDYALENRGKYHMVRFMRYCSRMDFQHLIHNIQNYNKLLKGPSKEFMA